MNISVACSGALLAFAVFAAGCRTIHETVQPDPAAFSRVVASPSLQDSLRHNILAIGMPENIAATIFSRNVCNSAVQVPSVGSRQQVVEVEGWGRKYADPSIRTFMDEFATPSGTLTVWYSYPDFYRMNVSRKDTLIAFWQGRQYPAVIQGLEASDRIVLASPLRGLPVDSTYYCEIHYRDNPRASITYWYGVRLRNDTMMVLPPSIPGMYPIQALEVDGNPVPSYHWKAQ